MSRISVLRAAACLTAMAFLTQSARSQTSAYTLLDKVEDAWVNRNPVPYRPMVAMPDGSFWAVNPYQSEVVHIVKDAVNFDFSIDTAIVPFRTLSGPVSIARYQPDVGNAQLLVVCQHANAVAIHDATSGDMLGAVAVRAGPGDILVDEDHDRAWVSCVQADKVVTIDLVTRTLQTEFDTSALSRSPGFLSMYGGEVLVAPRISGNGSLVDRKDFIRGGDPAFNGAQDFDEHAGERGILDTLDTNVADISLPDHDLIWLDLSTPPTPRPIAKTTGTLLFANAVQPGTSTLWQLNIDSNNKKADLQSEPKIQGQIVFNRVTMIPLPTPLAVITTPLSSVYLDRNTFSLQEPTLPTQYVQPSDAMATPYSLAFNSNGTVCAVAGLMSDDVVLLDGTGARRANGRFDLQETPADEVTMPRQVLILEDHIIAVWGGNLTVHFYDNLDSTIAQHDIVPLGYDPSPARVQQGRKIFFDASHSLHGNASCASCHDEGKTDMLAWNLSDIDAATKDGFDNKGPMVTQTLVSIAEAVPFHWRGEQLRGLVDFNPAFEKLLGGDRLDGVTESTGAIEANSEFDVFQAFVLSLTEDANQFQLRDRILDQTKEIPEDSLDAPLATGRPDNPGTIDTFDGQVKFASRCGNCHNFPNGTNNEVVDNAFGGEANPDRLWLKVSPFQGMQFKAKQHLVDVHFLTGTGAPDTQTYAILGTGVSHAGTTRDIIPFMDILLDPRDTAAFQEQRNIASFVYQWDTGTAPACHVFQLVDSTNAVNVIDNGAGDLNWLIGQAGTTNRNCDIAVIGRLTSGNPTAPFYGWVFDRKQTPAAFFGPDASGQNDGARDLLFFKNAALAGGRFAFVGMPVGTAWKFAVDFDGDQLPNHLETQYGYNKLVADTDGNSIWDGAQFYLGGEAAINNHAANNTPDFIRPDGVIDTSYIPGFQWVTLRVARLTFETDELTTADLTLTPQAPLTSLPVITVKELIPKMQHNMLVTSLVHPATYAVSLKITDRGSFSPPNGLLPKKSKTVNLPNLVMTNSAIVKQPTAAQDSFLMIGALTHPGTPVRHGTSDIWDFEYSATVVTEDDPGDGDAVPEPQQSIWVAARPLIKGVPATGSQFVPAAEQKLNGITFTTFDVNGIEYTPTGFIHDANDEPGVDPQNELFPPVLVPGAIPGPYAIGFNDTPPGTFKPTNTSGTCKIKFTLDLTASPPADEDKITLSIEAMGAKLTEVTTPVAHNRVNMTGNGSFGRFTDQHDGGITVGPFLGGGGKFPSLFSFPRTPASLRRIDLEFDGATQTWGPPD